MKTLYMRIPRERTKLFDYKLEWKILLDEDVIEQVVRPWVAKKVKEYLGTEEQAMIKLVIGLLAGGTCTPQVLLSRVGNILDEVAD